MSQEDVVYESFEECGKRLAKKLKEEEGCNFVIALTHMTEVNINYT